jgi:hypothetical protein
MTADNRLSLQQPSGGITDEKLGVAAIDPHEIGDEKSERGARPEMF